MTSSSPTSSLRWLAPRVGELAVLVDFDGTLAPIGPDPMAVRPDPAAKAALHELAARAAVVACVTGRRTLDARELLGLPELVYSGLHGAEQLIPGAQWAQLAPEYAVDAGRVADLIETARAEPQGLAGLIVEEKGPIVALHWRTAAEPVAAEARAHQLAARAEAAGLRSGVGRMVIELRPAAHVTKGDAARRIATDAGARLALCAGDDVTDLDAFRELRAMEHAGELERALLVGVAAPESPPEISALADLTVRTPAELGALLAELAALVATTETR